MFVNGEKNVYGDFYSKSRSDRFLSVTAAYNLLRLGPFHVFFYGPRFFLGPFYLPIVFFSRKKR